MQIAMEHDQRMRGSKSPINNVRNKPTKVILDNRNSLRNSKEIQKELELIRLENEMMSGYAK